MRELELNMKTFSHRTLWLVLLAAGCNGASKPAPAPVEVAATAGESAKTTEAPPPLAAEEKAQAPSHAPKVYDEKTSTISAHVGERFVVALPGNITTPLKWSLDPASMSDLVTLSSQSYSDAPPAECAGCVGYPGTAHFIFDAAQEGKTKLRFAYRKLGQTSGQAKREIVIDLTVGP